MLAFAYFQLATARLGRNRSFAPRRFSALYNRHEVRAMKNPALPRSCIRFGIFEFNPQTAELRKQGLRVRLWPQAAKALWVLLERPGEIRSREELQQRLWPNDASIDFERSLNKTIHSLREALGDSAANPRYIETLSGQGYRFIPIPQDRRSFGMRSRSTRRIDSLAVLPFLSDSADLELDFLNRSVVERIIDNLSREPGLRILAYRTVQTYRDKNLVATQVGRDLLVRAVAAGELCRRDHEVLLHVELIDVGDGTQLWGSQYRGSLVEVLADADELADTISGHLRRVLNPEARRMKATERAA